ncbi:exostosin-like glycosyltransferase [Micractinium conductrix]|uniref:Exostosin-like glycosyltransferase n=1 Tax=Micractinium conductrix TaxID=554055 RepID=A0A2P6V777_9CHLO|nr:exostosin-like glycosyltransferase [Micractinium conductrix]|eukprot:PSC69932.1 exostosin-like glycosyltransferase [Micractinium conductrix]
MGSKTCLWGDPDSPAQCNFVGVCDHLKGWCRCPAGWAGDDCNTRKRRPCSQKHRHGGFEPYDKPANLSEPRQLMSGCAGLCDEDIGYCMCDTQYRFGHEFAPVDAPPGSPPVKRGRPQGFHCQPSVEEHGNPSFGDNPPEELWGAEGWCQADEPSHLCPCILDGRGGPFCMGYTEMMCPNQCNGHGECNLGFCKCHDGWWGQDCAYRTPGTLWSPGLQEGERPWIKDLVHTPASKDPEPGATRKRPRIYVYELPALYNAWMLQYRPDKGTCVHRMFDDANGTRWVDEWLYAVEPGLHEAMLQSEHRTLDPEEADYFYIPVYTSCYIYPIHGFSDSPYFHSAYGIPRVYGAVNMLIEVYQWIRTHHPYWERNQGRDHIILQSHDEGSCWLPAVLRNATLLTHWGRTDMGHRSNTGFGSDNYTQLVE